MVCRSMLASETGEMDNARFRLTLGVSLGLGKRDTAEKETKKRMWNVKSPALLLTTFNTALTVNNLSIIYVWTKYNSASLKDFQSTSYSDSQLGHVYHIALLYFCA